MIATAQTVYRTATQHVRKRTYEERGRTRQTPKADIRKSPTTSRKQQRWTHPEMPGRADDEQTRGSLVTELITINKALFIITALMSTTFICTEWYNC